MDENIAEEIAKVIRGRRRVANVGGVAQVDERGRVAQSSQRTSLRMLAWPCPRM